MGSPSENRSFRRAVGATMIAGACTFLNVYCTQPLLPLLQHVFGASATQVSLTVGAVTLAVAVTAPLTGMLAESLGRKKVMVPALFGMAIPTLLAASSQTLAALIGWRFVQGLFVPGVIAVMIAYINEEFPVRAGTVMAAYVTGTVVGGFLGRFVTGLLATYGNWRLAFITLGVLDLLGALAVARWLPAAAHFVPAPHVSKSLRDTWGHLRNRRLLAVYALGFTVLFTLVGVFTYANFYLAGPPFHLTPVELGSIFFVYLLGCVVTPLAGRFLDRHGVRQTMCLSVAMSIGGLWLTLVRSLPVVIAGLAALSSGVFVSQSAATVLTGQVAGRALSAAAGLYVTFYYSGGTAGAALTGWCWRSGGWLACVGLFSGVSAVTLLLVWKTGPRARPSSRHVPANK